MNHSRPEGTPEILAPVGDWEMCQAAVHNGAHAVYIGAPHFNARGRTIDLTFEELEKMIRFCHLYGVKVFIALNILIFQDEFKKVLELLPQLLRLGPDAIIVQDLGLARFIRKLAPQQVLHASTQMTVTNHEAITLLEDLNFQRFVLGREVALPEMAIIKEHTERELEVFVHGALCVAYSGQCLTSENVGGRSANRGQCAQSCRLPYQLIVDDQKKEMGSRQYLVSPKDLYGLPEIPELLALGIDSFKIEGRLKAPEYVATTTRNYRQALDEALAKHKIHDARQELELAFSRDFFSGWLHSVNHQTLVDGRFSAHRGFQVGSVEKIIKGKKFPSLEITSDWELNTGDSLLFVQADLQEQGGGKIYQIETKNKNLYRIAFAGNFPLNKIQVGNSVYLNRSPKRDKQEQLSWKDRQQWKRIPLDFVVTGKLGQPLNLEVSDDQNHRISVSSKSPLQEASQAPLNTAQLKKDLGALGGTCFKIDRFECHLQGDLFLFNKEVKQLRQEAVKQLEEKRLFIAPQMLMDPQQLSRELLESRDHQVPPVESDSVAPTLHVLIRHVSQIKALEGLELGTVYLDLEHGSEYKPAVTQLHELGFQAGIATTRILKPKEYKHLRVIKNAQPDKVLIRNLGALQYYRQEFPQGAPFELLGDFSLNVTNSLTAEYLLSKGLQRLCPSYDLNKKQLDALLVHVDGKQLEVTVHQYIPSFHMEHCVFAAFLSKGTSYRDCGMPCEKFKVELQDEQGVRHPVKADQECRNTMYSGVAQSAAGLIPSFLQQGIRNFRIEALYESPEVLRQKILAYLEVIQGGQPPQKLFHSLGLMEKYGLGEGQLHRSHDYKDRKKQRK
ncbi:MAG: collagenase [SAR324 cluster bacterium]|uniref:Collagenase n=1 Tax=SAR324 cluster bacterium TaxID=2024889 RepID=A0A2A4T1T9_9DELT|nr:MAG: collagenase [SAR324 cluster bacterium]